MRWIWGEQGCSRRPTAHKGPPRYTHFLTQHFLFIACLSKHEAQLSIGSGWPTVPPVYEGQRSTLGRGKKAIFQSDYNFIHAVVTLLYRTLQLTPTYDMTIRLA